MPVYSLMDLADAGEGAVAFLVVAERQREHRVHGVIEPGDGGPRGGSEAAVIVHAGGDQGMGELQQDGSAPAQKDNALGVDPV